MVLGVGLHGPWSLFKYSYRKSLTLVVKNWPKWSRRFEHFRHASGLAKEEEESQINMQIYATGDQADNILNSFKLSATQLKRYH